MSGFASNTHAKTCAGLCAKTVMMDWSIGFKKGKKTPVEISKQMVSM
jgi:hypothetical protein